MPCTLSRRSGSAIAAQTVNLGPGGMRITSERPLAPDEVLRFDLPDQAVDGRCRVLRQDGHRTYALRFEGLIEGRASGCSPGEPRARLHLVPVPVLGAITHRTGLSGVARGYRAAWRTRLAIGAAALPPGPAPTSITATATRGLPAGANATNHASVFFGSGAPSAVGTQLGGAGLAGHRDARDRRRGAGPAAHHADHHLAHLRGDLRAHRAVALHLVAAHDPRPRAHALLGDRRADAGHPERRGEVAVLADRGRADGERVLQLAVEIVFGLAAGTRGRSLKPNASAARDQPPGAELGAERREHRVARDARTSWSACRRRTRCSRCAA